jgi:hypothetical protein
VDALAEKLRGKGAGEAVKRAGGPLLRLLEWLGANPRTVLLGLSMAAGSPLYYFIFELTVLNLLTIVSLMLHRRMNARLEAELEAMN